MSNEKTRILHTPDPKLTEAAAKGDPMAAALATEVAKEEAHPATRTVMARRAEEAKPASASKSVPDDVVRQLLASGGHRVHCPCLSNSRAPCDCGWGLAATEAEGLLGITAAKAAKAAEEMKAHGVTAVPG